MYNTIHNTHVNKAKTFICLIKHALKKNIKAFSIKLTFIAHTIEKCADFSVAFPADFLIKLFLCTLISYTYMLCAYKCEQMFSRV